ncbi:MAG: tetratricopeptide repeat protein [Desulfobulbaceae bacterium]|nr:tetratricopeptide repeat protein [Desulfobulbaceae bacterium]
MSEKHPLSKQVLETINIEKKPDIFEELNLPPEFASFCRKNGRNIRNIAICIGLIALAWAGYDYYQSTQIEKSTSFFASAMEEVTEDLRADKLVKLIEKHSGSDAALWSLVELGHTDQKAGNYQEAIDRYKQVLTNLDEDNPLTPLIHLSLAQSYEYNNDADNAIKQYKAMTNAKDFADMSYLALGRIYEKNGEKIKARDAYEKIENDQTGWAKERLAILIPPVNKGE